MHDLWILKFTNLPYCININLINSENVFGVINNHKQSSQQIRGMLLFNINIFTHHEGSTNETIGRPIVWWFCITLLYIYWRSILPKIVEIGAQLMKI